MLDKELARVILKEGDILLMDVDVPAKFKVGDRIKTRNIRPKGHTRLVQYVRGKEGIIQRDHGVYPLPDTAIDGDDRPQHVYSVKFSARELWGEEAPETDSLCIDLWDDYMDPTR